MILLIIAFGLEQELACSVLIPRAKLGGVKQLTSSISWGSRQGSGNLVALRRWRLNLDSENQRRGFSQEDDVRVF